MLTFDGIVTATSNLLVIVLVAGVPVAVTSTGPVMESRWISTGAF